MLNRGMQTKLRSTGPAVTYLGSRCGHTRWTRTCKTCKHKRQCTLRGLVVFQGVTWSLLQGTGVLIDCVKSYQNASALCCINLGAARVSAALVVAACTESQHGGRCLLLGCSEHRLL